MAKASGGTRKSSSNVAKQYRSMNTTMNRSMNTTMGSGIIKKRRK